MKRPRLVPAPGKPIPHHRHRVIDDFSADKLLASFEMARFDNLPSWAKDLVKVHGNAVHELWSFGVRTEAGMANALALHYIACEKAMIRENREYGETLTQKLRKPANGNT
jgi:hypothetical protein